MTSESAIALIESAGAESAVVISLLPESGPSLVDGATQVRFREKIIRVDAVDPTQQVHQYISYSYPIGSRWFQMINYTNTTKVLEAR